MIVHSTVNQDQRSKSRMNCRLQPMYCLLTLMICMHSFLPMYPLSSTSNMLNAQRSLSSGLLWRVMSSAQINCLKSSPSLTSRLCNTCSVNLTASPLGKFWLQASLNCSILTLPLGYCLQKSLYHILISSSVKLVDSTKSSRASGLSLALCVFPISKSQKLFLHQQKQLIVVSNTIPISFVSKILQLNNANKDVHIYKLSIMTILPLSVLQINCVDNGSITEICILSIDKPFIGGIHSISELYYPTSRFVNKSVGGIYYIYIYGSKWSIQQYHCTRIMKYMYNRPIVSVLDFVTKQLNGLSYLLHGVYYIIFMNLNMKIDLLNS